MIEVKKKEVENSFFCFSVPYGDMQSFLAGMYPFGCTRGVYGWNANCYLLPYSSNVIVTGYRTFGKRIPDEIINDFENRSKNCSFSMKQELVKEFDTVLFNLRR